MVENGAHGVACARATIGNPWLILNIANKLSQTQNNFSEPTLENRLKVALIHTELTFEDKGERGVQALKRHMSKYLSGMQGASVWRQKLALSNSYSQTKNILQEMLSLI